MIPIGKGERKRYTFPSLSSMSSSNNNNRGDGGDGTGKNMLGKTLMAVRSALRQQAGKTETV
jgi:hypothetical protein